MVGGFRRDDGMKGCNLESLKNAPPKSFLAKFLSSQVHPKPPKNFSPKGEADAFSKKTLKFHGNLWVPPLAPENPKKKEANLKPKSPENCEPEHFKNMKLVFDITFCGDRAGGTTFDAHCGHMVNENETCIDFVRRWDGGRVGVSLFDSCDGC